MYTRPSTSEPHANWHMSGSHIHEFFVRVHHAAQDTSDSSRRCTMKDCRLSGPRNDSRQHNFGLVHREELHDSDCHFSRSRRSRPVHPRYW